MAAKLPTGVGRTTPAPSNVNTLPLSCQICLGKVKQPALCSNFHVFCRSCIDTWLERSNLCPSCRVIIDHTNPVQQIRGGLGHIDEDDREKSSPELRKTRFDLLYRDYEDTLEHMEREVQRLRCENARLKSHLSLDQVAGIGISSNGGVGGVGGGGGGGGGRGTGGNEQQLQLLTGKLQDAQKLYDRVKQDIGKMKKENHSLKEGNANLSHENNRLREEISSRSPHKFGRLTVATLEAQVESQRKEVQRLTRALERSDHYIESLQLQMDQGAAASGDPDHTAGNKVSTNSNNGAKTRVPIHVQPPTFSRDSVLPVKRQLFPAKSLKESNLSSVDGKGASRSVDGGNRFSERSSSPPTFGKSFDPKSADALESIMRKSDTSPKTDARRDKSPTVKKVHFSTAEKKSNDSSSFNLEVPSPIVPSDCSASSDKLPSRHQDTALRKPVHRSGGRPVASSSDRSHPLQKGNDLSSRRVSSFTSNIKEEPLRQKYDGGKEAGEPGGSSNLSEPEFATPQSLNELESGKFLGKSAAFSKQTAGRQNKSRSSQGANSSFSLEEPSLDDTQTIQTELKDLDISVTPELSDCLKLLNRAERKVSYAETPGLLMTTAGTMSAGNVGCAPTYSTAAQPPLLGKHYSVSGPDRAPELSSDRVKGGVHVDCASGYPGSSDFTGLSGPPGTYVPGTTGVMSGWEHGFFSSLRVNPFKHAAPNMYVAPANQKPNGISNVMPDEFKSLLGQARTDQPFYLPVSSQNSALTDVRRSEFHPMSTGPSSSRIPTPSAYSNMTRSSSLDGLSVPSSSAGNSSAGLAGRQSSLSSEPPVTTNFLSDRACSSQPVTDLKSSMYPMNITSSSGFNHMHDMRGYNNSACLSEQPKSLSCLTALETGECVSRDRRTPNNYSYVSNASSQGIDNTDSNYLDSFLPEPKKRLFDLDSEEESEFGTPSKTTKIL
ncbi:hypothetical protein ACOMHN_017817 [Nucella lapillus]